MILRFKNLLNQLLTFAFVLKICRRVNSWNSRKWVIIRAFRAFWCTFYRVFYSRSERVGWYLLAQVRLFYFIQKNILIFFQLGQLYLMTILQLLVMQSIIFKRLCKLLFRLLCLLLDSANFLIIYLQKLKNLLKLLIRLKNLFFQIRYERLKTLHYSILDFLY